LVLIRIYKKIDLRGFGPGFKGACPDPGTKKKKIKRKIYFSIFIHENVSLNSWIIIRVEPKFWIRIHSFYSYTGRTITIWATSGTGPVTL
jgi:hypothetical protein